MDLVDTHCHIDSLSNEERQIVIKNAFEVSVTRLICVGASKGTESVESAVSLARNHDFIWASVGFHPHDAGLFHDLSQIECYLAEPRVVAIGETGLDFFRDWAPRDRQSDLFRASIRAAKKAGKPLIIHSRNASQETLELLKSENADVIGGVFHCYAEDAKYAAALREMNFFVSFTGSLTFKRAENLRNVARDIPLSQIMLETDSPYMAPEPYRGMPSEPMHVLQIAQTLAAIKNVSLDEVAQTTTANALSLFKFGSF